MFTHGLGEMKAKNGSTLWHQVDETCVQYAFRIINSVKALPVYKELLKRLPSERVPLYFFRAIKSEIYPFVLRGQIIQWYRRQNLPIDRKSRVIYVRGNGIFKQLERIWDIEDVPIKSVHPFSTHILYDDLLRTMFNKSFKAIVKKSLYGLRRGHGISSQKDYLLKPFFQGKIACHYNEGIDSGRRCDIHWFADSGLRPEQVIIYFDDLSTVLSGGKPIGLSVINRIEKQGFQWISLREGSVEDEKGHLWMPPPLPDGWLIKDGKDPLIERWVIDTGNQLLRETHYWRSFHDSFGVRVHYITEEGFARNIAQAIAFDIDREKSGLLVGRQRSELFLSSDHLAVQHPKHLFFVWNKRAEKYLTPNHNHISQLLITGYQNNVFQKFDRMDEELRLNGASFIIAMFDSGHHRDAVYSTKAMSEYYSAFLRLVIADPSIGLIIKPKKEKFFKTLFPETHELFKKAAATGRCVKIEDSWGRLPAEASFGADIAVGIGSPSAVIEAVIAGQRGIFYDISSMKDHEFYGWGYNRIIFNDLGNMISAVNRYKESPADNASLGDWSAKIDELDPFRDGKGGQRMGTYMRWLLESFDNGCSRGEAIEYATARYAGSWGGDKVVRLHDSDKVACPTVKSEALGELAS